MKTTKAFEESVVDFLEDAREEFPDTEIDREYVIDAAGVFTENGRNDPGIYQAVISVAEGEELSFYYKCYIDPLTKKNAFAASDEPVIEWADSIDNAIFQEALLPGNPEAHVITHDPVHEWESGYCLAVCNDGFGHVDTHAFDSPSEAMAFAWGLSPDEIKHAVSQDCGTLYNSEYSGVMPHEVFVEPGLTDQGVVYKDMLAFEMCKKGYDPNTPVYIPEYGIDVAFEKATMGEGWNFSGGWYPVEDCDFETYQDILDTCHGHVRVAEHVLKAVDWQSTSTYYDETEQEDPAMLCGLIAGVDDYDNYTYLDYQETDDHGCPVYQVIDPDDESQYVKDVNCGSQGLSLHGFSPENESKGSPDSPYQSDREIRFVSIQGLELPENARMFNLYMQEKSTFASTIAEMKAQANDAADEQPATSAPEKEQGLEH